MEENSELLEDDRFQCSDEHEGRDIDDFYCRYGWGRFRPDFLQRFNTPGWLVVWSCFLLVTSSLTTLQLMPSTIERRFGFSSTDVGTFTIPCSITTLFALILISYYSEHGNKVRWVSWTGLCCVLGNALILTTRDIMSPIYNTPSPGNYSGKSAIETVMCSDQSRDHCQHESGKNSVDGSNMAWYIFAFGAVLASLGAASHFSTMFSYIDENVSRSKSMVYNGILMGAQGITLAVSVGVAGFSITLPEDFDQPNPVRSNLKPGDANFIGAWWLPSYIAAVATIIGLIPYSGYPKRLPRGRNLSNSNYEDILHRKGSSEHKKGQTSLFDSFKTILSTKTFVYGTARQSMEFVLISGFVTFMSKMLEVEFGFSTEIAMLLPGLIGVLPAVVGTIISGYIAAKLKLQLRGLYTMSLCALVISFAISLPYLFPCPTPKFAGVSVPYSDFDSTMNFGYLLSPNHRNLHHSCNAKCNCVPDFYDPHCSTDGITYYSPCHAGCKDDLSKCACLQKTVRDSDQQFSEFIPSSLIRGSCNGMCPWRPLIFCIATAFMSGISSSGNYLITQSNLVCVPFNMRTLALGIQVFFADIFGSMWGSAIFGRMFDINCILWREVCQKRTSCILYNTHAVTYMICGLCAILKIGQMIVLYLAIKSIPGDDGELRNYFSVGNLKRCVHRMFYACCCRRWFR